VSTGGKRRRISVVAAGEAVHERVTAGEAVLQNSRNCCHCGKCTLEGEIGGMQYFRTGQHRGRQCLREIKKKREEDAEGS